MQAIIELSDTAITNIKGYSGKLKYINIPIQSIICEMNVSMPIKINIALL